jgi:hypothetical protein
MTWTTSGSLPISPIDSGGNPNNKLRRFLGEHVPAERLVRKRRAEVEVVVAAFTEENLHDGSVHGDGFTHVFPGLVRRDVGGNCGTGNCQ